MHTNVEKHPILSILDSVDSSVPRNMFLVLNTYLLIEGSY